MFRVICESQLSFAGKTLVIPAVSVGSAPTLALDLLLNTLGATRAGWIYSTDFLPIVGQNALDLQSEPLSYPLELYVVNELIVLQIRSLCRDSKGFIEKLVAFAKDQQIRNILLLGSNSDELKPTELDADLFYIRNSQSAASFELPSKDYEEYKSFFSGAGLCKQLLKRKDVECTAVIIYAREVPADVESAFQLARGVAGVFQVGCEYKVPRSWQGILS